MKITDYQTIDACIRNHLEDVAPSLMERLGIELSVWCVMAIYLMGDTTKGYGQDFTQLSPQGINFGVTKMSVISYKAGVSVIIDNQMSRYQDNIDMIGYQSLDEDITAILMYIETAICRIETRP